MIIQCNRLFNALNKYAYNTLFIVVLLVLSLGEVVSIATSDGILVSLFILVAAFVPLFVMFFLTLLFNFPKNLLVDEERIEYSMRLYECYKDGVSPVITKPHRFKRLANVSNSQIKEIIYSSSKLERFFKIGHIQINAKTYITDKNGEAFYIFNTSNATLIYGIKDFENVKIKLKKALPNTKHIEK